MAAAKMKKQQEKERRLKESLEERQKWFQCADKTEETGVMRLVSKATLRPYICSRNSPTAPLFVRVSHGRICCNFPQLIESNVLAKHKLKVHGPKSTWYGKNEKSFSCVVDGSCYDDEQYDPKSKKKFQIGTGFPRQEEYNKAIGLVALSRSLACILTARVHSCAFF